MLIGLAPAARARDAFVLNEGSDDVSVINTQTNQVVGTPITVGSNPEAIAITPDGRFAYVANAGADSVSMIDTHTNQVLGAPIAVGNASYGIAISPDGRSAYTANEGSGGVSVINTQTNQPIGTPIAVGEDPYEVAITPNQALLASFSVAGARPRVPVSFNAAASSDPDGSVGTYARAFGDGLSATQATPTASHSYARPGIYMASLTVTDDEGCSTARVYTGQMVLCNGSPSAAQVQAVRVVPPGVALRCSKRARPGGCSFVLQAVSKKRKGRPESSVARARARSGKSVTDSLKPKKAFRSRLAAARWILVRRTTRIDGIASTSFARLKVIR